MPVDDFGAIAGLLNDDDILSEVLEEDQNHCSDDDTQDEPTRHRTVQKATEALAVLAELCICSGDSERPQHHHMGLKKTVRALILMTRQTKLTKFFIK